MTDGSPPARRGLGRGLAALMADLTPSPSEPGRMEIDGQTVRRLPVDQLRRNPNQPRQRFDEAELDELAASLTRHGMLQPILCRPLGDEGVYEIVAGERRWRAAQRAKLHDVPVVVRTFSDDEVLQAAIIENVQRSDLNAMDEAQAYAQLIDRFGHTQEQLGEVLSKSRSHVANMMRLLKLPEPVKEQVRQGTLSSGHARALVGHPDAERLGAMVVGRGLNVRQTEELVRKSLASQARPPRKGSRSSEKDADTRAIESDLSAGLGMAVSIRHDGPSGGGQLVVNYRSLNDLDDLCRALSALAMDRGS